MKHTVSVTLNCVGSTSNGRDWQTPIFDENNVYVGCGIGADENESLKNAKLQAAAPELLEALKDMVAWCNIKDGSPNQYLRDNCLTAIKKATL